jgi:HPt (histidine-containing phosphotransfer) domain-containing protein
LTANVMARERERYLGAGMNDCLMKPIDWDQLHAALLRFGASAPARPAALVDARVLEKLRGAVGAGELDGLVREGIVAFGGYCDAMLLSKDRPADIAREAHKVKGSAGTLGLCGITSAAERIESAAGTEDGGMALVQALRETIDATRHELVALGFIGSAGSVAVS